MHVLSDPKHPPPTTATPQEVQHHGSRFCEAGQANLLSINQS